MIHVQSRVMSLVEAVANVIVGFGIAVATQLLVFPLFGLYASLTDNLSISALFTIASLARSYVVRRVFERLIASGEQGRAPCGHPADQRTSRELGGLE